MSRPTFFTMIPGFLLGLFMAGPLSAQVHYEGERPWSQKAGDGPDAEVPGWYYNLGITSGKPSSNSKPPPPAGSGIVPRENDEPGFLHRIRRRA